MSEITAKVFMILYRYGEKDYSVVKIMSTLEKAYNYICSQIITINKIKLLEIDRNYDKAQIEENNSYILYIKSGKYLHLDLDDNENIQPYIIVPMNIE
jgi:hypothetical protein